MSERSETTILSAGEMASVTVPPRRVRLQDVARHAGLARTTVSDILNRRAADRYSDETRRRVEGAMHELGYAPARAAQQLARGRSGQIGLLLTRDFANPYFARVAHVVEQEARKRDVRLQLALCNGDAATEAERIRQMQTDQVEGLLVGPIYESVDLQQHREILRGRLPLVIFGSAVGSEFDEVSLDSTGGLDEAVAYLARCGHRRVAFLVRPHERGELRPTDDLRDRLRRVGADLVHVEWEDDTGLFETFHAASVRFIEQWKAADASKRATAVLCLNDQVALTAISAFHRAGVRVPDDLSVVGVDNLPETPYFVPALTTIDTQVQQQMELAVEVLLERLANPSAPRIRRSVTSRLIVRDSVRTLYE